MNDDLQNVSTITHGGRKILITGGLGFIGSNLVTYWLRRYPDDEIVVLDAKTYAAREDHFRREIRSLGASGLQRCKLEVVNIQDHLAVARAMNFHRPTDVIHLAAESHVCRSITGPKEFVLTNIVGTFHLLEEFKNLWQSCRGHHRFHHISTDEVFGELQEHEEPWTEESPLKPRSPYAASKAASEHLVQSYHHTYGLDTVITNCTNNFGPNQHEEKLIPKAILKMLRREPMTIYGDGLQIRDWLHVDDHCAAIELVFNRGLCGEKYLVDADNARSNLEVVEMIYSLLKERGKEVSLNLNFTNDRPTDDRRYSLEPENTLRLGWKPYREKTFQQRLSETIDWYLDYYGRQGIVL